MISNYKVKVNDSCNYKVSITDIQNKYKFKLFCAGADLTDYYTKEQVDQSQNTQDILIDNILNQIPTGTATGETINITDSSSLPLKDIQVAGNTYQETTTGKNLFDKDNANTINLFINNSNSKLVTTTEGTGCFYIPCEANTTYTVSKTELFGNDRFCVFDTARVPTAGDTVLSFVGSRSGVDTHTSYTITTTATATYLGVFVKAGTNPNKTMQEIAKTIQIEKNSSATSYEKYTGGNPAPNPDYPQTISNVTGTNAIKINGKNLLDESSLETGGIDESTGQNIYNQYRKRSDYISIDSNTTYSLSCLVSSGIWLIFYHYDKNKEFISSNPVNASNGIASDITPNNCIFIRVVIGNTASLTATNIQLEISSTATTYEAYKEQSYTINLGNIELCKIGDYKDRIYYSSGKWYLEKNIGKIVLNGTENWLLRSDVSQTYNYYSFRNDDYVEGAFSTNSNGYSNYFKIVTSTTINENNIRLINFTGYGTQICISGDIVQTEEALKLWLNNHNVTVYYILATPTTTEITDATLIGQLDALLNSTTYKTTTNITVDTTNQQPTLTLTYRKDLETLIGG